MNKDVGLHVASSQNMHGQLLEFISLHVLMYKTCVQVLIKEGAIDPSPPTLNILSVSDPPSRGTTCGHACADVHTCTSRVYGLHYPSNSKGKHAAKATPAMRWADVARKGAKERDKRDG
jgi:hypothetical protein